MKCCLKKFSKKNIRRSVKKVKRGLQEMKVLLKNSEDKLLTAEAGSIMYKFASVLFWVSA